MQCDAILCGAMADVFQQNLWCFLIHAWNIDCLGDRWDHFMKVMLINTDAVHICLSRNKTSDVHPLPPSPAHTHTPLLKAFIVRIYIHLPNIIIIGTFSREFQSIKHFEEEIVSFEHSNACSAILFRPRSFSSGCLRLFQGLFFCVSSEVPCEALRLLVSTLCLYPLQVWRYIHG